MKKVMKNGKSEEEKVKKENEKKNDWREHALDRRPAKYACVSSCPLRLLVTHLPYSWILKMEVMCCFEVSVNFCRITRRSIPEEVFFLSGLDYAAGWTTEESRFDSWQVTMFLLSRTALLGLGSTQQRVPRSVSREEKQPGD
jgi:hypothetical protein